MNDKKLPGFFRGLSMPFRGIGFVVRNPRLARIWILPVILVILLTTGGCMLSSWASHWAADSLTGPQPDVVSRAVVHWAAQLVVLLVGGALSMVLAIVLAPVVAAPFNELLGEEVERIELGIKPPDFSVKKMGRDVFRTVRLELAKLAFYLIVVGPLALVGLFVGPLGFVASVVGFFFTAAYFALDYVDGPLTRRNVGVRRRFQLLRQHPAPMLGFGIGVWLVLFVPFVNLFFMPAAVVGGTRLCAELGLIDLAILDLQSIQHPDDDAPTHRAAVSRADAPSQTDAPSRTDADAKPDADASDVEAGTSDTGA